ncbi:MAG: hypothetical protein WC150_10295 [Bacteroidia bacterium]
MDSGFSSIRTKDKLEIAVSTDTVLYLPFYVAYYGNDFHDTPFSELEVVIIGTKNDFRFDQSKKLKGDGFATFSVLLGLADAAICDPSHLIYLNHCDATKLQAELKKFQDLLDIKTKKDICNKEFNLNLSQCLDVDNSNNLVFKENGVNLFKEKILKTNTKVIGGLVSKIAFLAVGSGDLTSSSNDLGRLYKNPQNFPSQYGKENITQSIICYDTPSTGFCIGHIYYEQYKTSTSTLVEERKDFGYELRKVSKKTYKNNGTIDEEVDNDDYCNNSVSFSCDFISIDFLLDKHNGEANKKIIELENLAYDNDQSFMFTGILGNNAPENSEKLKGLLYGIDKNLHRIHSYLKKSDTTGLIHFLKTKLKYDDDTQDELLNLLIADETIKSYIQFLINNKKEKFSLEEILKYYVDRLREWRDIGNLYYSKTNPIKDDLKELTLLRYRAEGIPVPQTIDYSLFVADDLLAEYRQNEKHYFELERKTLHTKKWAGWRIFLTPLLPFLYLLKLFTNKVENFRLFIESSLWKHVRKPTLLYFIGSLFILLEITSSMFHILHPKTPKLDELKHEFARQEVVPNSDPIEYKEVLHTIKYGNYIFYCFLICLVIVFLSSRELFKLKHESKYFYRNE